MESQDKRSRTFVLIACMGVMFMTAVEGTIIATAMPTVAGALGGYALAGWIFAAYLLAQATTIPIYGRLADLFGRKPMFFIGASAFIVGSAICGSATSMPMLIFGRAVQGLGAGGIVPVAQTIIGDAFNPAERARIQGYLASMWGISAIFGPVLGAFMVQKLSWPVIFWFNIPLALIVMGMLAFMFRETHRRAEHSIDILGAVLLVISVGGIMLCLMQAKHLGNLFWPILVAATICFVLLVLHERRTAEPLIPLALWENRIIRTCNFGSLMVGAASMMVAVFLPTYIQGVMGRDAYAAGICLAFLSIAWPIGATTAGRIMLRTSYRSAVTIGGILLIIGSVLLTLMEPVNGMVWACAGATFVGVGLGFLNTPFVVAVQDVAAWNLRGAATASNAFNRMLGASLGTAVFSAVMNASLVRSLPTEDDPIQDLVDPAKRATLDAATLIHVSDAVATAMEYAFAVGVVIAVVALIIGRGLPPGMKPGNVRRGTAED